MGRRRLYPLQPLVGVGALIRKDGEVLLIKRATEPNKGRWTLPGGLVELGEEVRAAVRREIEEELGLTLEVGKLIGVFDIIQRDPEGKIKFHYVTVDFLAKPSGGTLRMSREVENARWLSPAQAWRLDLTPAVRGVLRRVGFVDPATP